MGCTPRPASGQGPESSRTTVVFVMRYKAGWPADIFEHHDLATLRLWAYAGYSLNRQMCPFNGYHRASALDRPEDGANESQRRWKAQR